MKYDRYFPGLLIFTVWFFLAGCKDNTAEISSERVRIAWKEKDGLWKTTAVSVRIDDYWKDVGTPSGEYAFLYSAGKPDDSTLTVFKTSTGVAFPEPEYRYQKKGWAEATNPVTLNTAGQPVYLFPQEARRAENQISFTSQHDLATVTATWSIDPHTPSDIVVSQVLVAKKAGYFSLVSPTLTTISPDNVAWATVPGYFQSNQVKSDFVSAYAYGHGIPENPVIYRERTISTLTAIIDTKDSASISIIPAPGLGRDPWKKDHSTQSDWSIAISHRNRRSALTPTLYYPVLGEPQSRLEAGDSIKYQFRFSVVNGNWYDNLSHAIYDVYKFKEGLSLRRNKQSLSERVIKMHGYLTDAKTSMWKVENFEGIKIGAQSYLGGVVGSNRDAMKNADYGAMWMLARATGDPYLEDNVLPYALNFKMKQQETSPGFFQGAAIGQYYLAKRKEFVEEWGEFIEPVGLTYYAMLDIGNLSLFEPTNAALKKRLRLGGDRLLEWQQRDGSWVVAYDRETHKPLFQDLQDLRPTFYGLVVAHRILKDQKYLDGAIRGADWLITNGVDKGHFIGVCGDARYAPDFGTGQTAQAFLDLYDLTKNEKYLDAAIRTAQIYTASIYTHPVPSNEAKVVKGRERKDWEITQAGLSFEHGGLMGSAQRHGPIQLASHAGLFVRMFKLTKDSLFIDMARAAAIGRDAFVDSATSVASYYWETMDRGAGPYPHHAWWQIGWITDYLMAEAELRSEGQINFPRGFVAPKVGPHQTYGFANGTIYNEPAALIIREGLVKIEDPNVEFITALSPSAKRLYIVTMNDITEPIKSSISVDVNKIKPGLELTNVSAMDAKRSIGKENTWSLTLNPYGLQVFAVNME